MGWDRTVGPRHLGDSRVEHGEAGFWAWAGAGGGQGAAWVRTRFGIPRRCGTL